MGTPVYTQSASWFEPRKNQHRTLEISIPYGTPDCLAVVALGQDICRVAVARGSHVPIGQGSEAGLEKRGPGSVSGGLTTESRSQNSICNYAALLPNAHKLCVVPEARLQHKYICQYFPVGYRNCSSRQSCVGVNISLYGLCRRSLPSPVASCQSAALLGATSAPS